MSILVEVLGQKRVDEVAAKYGIDENGKRAILVFLEQTDDVLRQMEISLAQVPSAIEIETANTFKACLELLMELIGKKLDERSAPKH